MKIRAIWDRHIPASGSKMIFCLLNTGELLELKLETEFQGENAEGKRLYKETGRLNSGSAFGEEDRFTFRKADYWVKHFGGTLLVNFGRKQEERMIKGKSLSEKEVWEGIMFQRALDKKEKEEKRMKAASSSSKKVKQASNKPVVKGKTQQPLGVEGKDWKQQMKDRAKKKGQREVVRGLEKKQETKKVESKPETENLKVVGKDPYVQLKPKNGKFVNPHSNKKAGSYLAFEELRRGGFVGGIVDRLAAVFKEVGCKSDPESRIKILMGAVRTGRVVGKIDYGKFELIGTPKK